MAMIEESPTGKMVSITRVFDAPRELVFKAWTTAASLERWSAPEGCTLKIHAFDFRPGGMFHHTIKTPTGYECTCKGEYREIVERERIVYTITFADRDGKFLTPKEAGAAPDWPEETVVTVTFEKHQGGTKLTLQQTVSETVATRTGALPSWIQMLDRLSGELRGIAAK